MIQMDLNTLRDTILKKKISAFDEIWSGRAIDPKILGYTSHEERALAVIRRTAAEIEKINRRWERENPD